MIFVAKPYRRNIIFQRVTFFYYDDRKLGLKGALLCDAKCWLDISMNGPINRKCIVTGHEPHGGIVIMYSSSSGRSIIHCSSVTPMSKEKVPPTKWRHLMAPFYKKLITVKHKKSLQIKKSCNKFTWLLKYDCQKSLHTPN